MQIHFQNNFTKVLANNNSLEYVFYHNLTGMNNLLKNIFSSIIDKSDKLLCWYDLLSLLVTVFSYPLYVLLVTWWTYSASLISLKTCSVRFSSVAQSCPTLCDPMNHSTPGLPVHTNSQSSLRFMSIESVMPSSHLILCRPLLLLPPIPPSIRVFSNESTLHMTWPKYWSFSFSINPSKEHPGLVFRMDWLDLLAVQGTLKSLLQHHSSKASILWRSAFSALQSSQSCLARSQSEEFHPWQGHAARALMARLIRPQVFPLEFPEHPPPRKKYESACFSTLLIFSGKSQIRALSFCIWKGCFS